jgi:ATP-dependent RNA helicase DDX5/DBP2
MGRSESSGGRYDAPGRNLKSVDFSEENLPPVNKNLYREDESVMKMSEEEITAWRAEHNMEILGEGCPRPVFEFAQTSFPPFIQKHLTKLFPSGPSPIQSQGWPLSSSGRDVIASAQTGSGKTIAFVLPALEHIHGQPKLEPGAPGADQPVALFLAPTRELAMQIHEETKRFAGFYGYRTACVYGGAQNRMEQTRQLVSKPHIVIATPGRLLDFVESKMVNLARVSYVVLDEADRMLDMGFEPQVRSVLGQIRPDRQTLMWSATWPKRVQDLASSFLKSPIRIRIGSDELSANRNVTQEFIFSNWNERLDRLVDIMKERKGQKMLIFTSTKMNADLLADELYDHGHRVQSLHGDKAQGLRTRILNDFKTGRSNILIATDVAARGIDVSDIQVVVNYNMPNNSEDYVHRIGRTGRAGRTGTSISFFAESDEALIPELVPILTESGQQVPTEFSDYLEARRAERASKLRNFGSGGPRRGGYGGYKGGSGGYKGRSSSGGGYGSRPPRR